MKKELVAIHKREATASLVDDLDSSVESVRFRFEPLYSGGVAFIEGFDAPAVVDLATLRVDPAPKALLEHDPDAVVGRLENIDNDGRRVNCDAVVGGTKLSAKVVEWAKNVANWSASIGVYRFTDDDVEFVPSGRKAEANGREFSGPVYIVHNGSLAEGSFVAIGGDGEARSILAKIKGASTMKFNVFKASEGSPTDEEKKLDGEIEIKDEEKITEAIDDEKKATCEETATDLEEIVVDAVEQAVEDSTEAIPADVSQDVIDEIVTELADEELLPVEASVKASKLAKAKLAKATAKGSRNAQATLAENRRVAGIQTLVASYGKDGAKIAAKAIAGGWSLERTERVLNASAKRREFVAGMKGTTFGRATAGNGPSPQNIVAASFAKTLGLDDKRAAKAFGEDAVDAATRAPYRGMTFKSVVAASLNSFKPGAYDVFTGAASGWNECKSECLRARLLGGGSFRAGAGAGFSTISAVDVFQLVLQAFLEPSAETAPRIYKQITRENKVVDFNTIKSFLPTIQGRLQKISETGAIQNVGMTTEEFEHTASPYAAVFTIPEITVVNDRLDAFAELLRQLEQLGDDCVEHDVAETFWRLVDGDIKDANSNALVSAAVGNYIASGSLDETGLAAALTAMNSFSNANGVPLASDNLQLITGSKLTPASFKLAHAGLIDFQTGTAYPNFFNGRFKPVEWTYLDSAHARAVKDDGSTPSLFASDKTWILLRDPQRRPAVCVNKVVGFESPRVEQFEADPTVWGTTYRYVYPYGVNAQYKDAIVATTNS